MRAQNSTSPGSVQHSIVSAVSAVSFLHRGGPEPLDTAASFIARVKSVGCGVDERDASEVNVFFLIASTQH